MTPMTITPDWIGATKTVDGYRASKHFGTHRTEFGRGWHLTHLPSGRSVPYSRRATAKACRVLAARLERLRGGINWDRVTPSTVFTSAQRSRILAIAWGPGYVYRRVS